MQICTSQKTTRQRTRWKRIKKKYPLPAKLHIQIWVRRHAPYSQNYDLALFLSECTHGPSCQKCNPGTAIAQTYAPSAEAAEPSLTRHDRSPFPLLKLPRAIRYRIAECVFQVDEGLDWQWTAAHPLQKCGTFRDLRAANALAYTCRQLHNELSGLIFNMNVLNFDASRIYAYMPQTKHTPSIATALYAFEFFWLKSTPELRQRVQCVRFCANWTAFDSFDLSLHKWPLMVRESMPHLQSCTTWTKKDYRSYRRLNELAQSSLHVLVCPLDWKMPSKSAYPKLWPIQLDTFVAFTEGLEIDERDGRFGGGERQWRMMPYFRGLEEDLSFFCYYVSFSAYALKVREWCLHGF